MKIPKIKVKSFVLKPVNGGGYTWVGRPQKVLINIIEHIEKEVL